MHRSAPEQQMRAHARQHSGNNHCVGYIRCLPEFTDLQNKAHGSEATFETKLDSRRNISLQEALPYRYLHPNPANGFRRRCPSHLPAWQSAMSRLSGKNILKSTSSKPVSTYCIYSYRLIYKKNSNILFFHIRINVILSFRIKS